MFRPMVALMGMALLTLALSTHAAQPELTDAKVRGYIASLHDLEQYEDQFAMEDGDEMDFDTQDSVGEDWAPISEGVRRFKGHPSFNQFESVVKNNGFSSAQQWGQTGDRILHAYMALEMEREAPDMQREMQEALHEIDNNPQMSAEQKEAMRQMMMGAMSSMEAMANAPQADIDAVRPHMGALRNAFQD